jgi:hypothetical protein
MDGVETTVLPGEFDWPFEGREFDRPIMRSLE